MQTLLLLTRNLSAQDELCAAAEKNGIRSRVVSSFHAAADWLSRQRFDVLMIDLDLEPLQAGELVHLAWKHSAHLSSAAFSLGTPAAESWGITLLGTKLFYGPQAISDGVKFLLSLPKPLLLPDTEQSFVLFVEDLDSPRDIVEAYIKSLGFENVHSVASAKEGLQALFSHPKKYFCVLADIHMPVMNGIRLTEEIRNSPEISHIPIVILTADPTTENVVECVRAGATGFLAKPPKKKELLRELEKSRRIIAFGQSPRLCAPEDAKLLHGALRKLK